MDLALELGTPYEPLAASMTEREFANWYAYSLKRQLPYRRIEIYLAQIALVVARTIGGSKATLEDFMWRVDEPIEPADQVQAAKQAFGFSPRKK